MSSHELRFHWTDYLVLILALVISSMAGLVQGLVDHVTRKKKMDANVNRGTASVERNISVWPAALSVLSSSLAAPFVIGVPSEIYAFGIQFVYLFVGIVIATPFVTHFMFVRFYELKIKSVYEYLEFRFNKFVRTLCSAIFAISLLMYIGIITFAPAVVFSRMTGTSMISSVFGVGLLGIVYTVVGGLKGVMWADAIQMLILLASLLAIIIKGCTDLGGVAEIIDINLIDGRLEGPIWSPDPFIRHSIWTQAIGGSITCMVILTNQAIVQKFIGLPSLKKMYITSYTYMIVYVIYLFLFAAAGLIIYAHYSGCSPLITGSITRLDELVPVFVLESFQNIPGMAGLFTAAVFSASLSSMTGGINALATVTLLDVLQPIYKRRNNSTNMSPKLASITFKLLVVIYGLLTIGTAYLAPLFGKGLLQLVFNLIGIVSAPMLAVFIMGIFMPCINSKGSAAGLLSSLVVMFMISIGGLYVSNKYSLQAKELLPLSNSTCSITNRSEPIAKTAFSPVSNSAKEELGGIEKFLSISYMWYSVIAIAVAFLVGFLVSWVTGFRNNEEIDNDLSYLCCYKKKHMQAFDEDETKITLRVETNSDDIFRKEKCSSCRRSWIVATSRF